MHNYHFSLRFPLYPPMTTSTLKTLTLKTAPVRHQTIQKPLTLGSSKLKFR